MNTAHFTNTRITIAVKAVVDGFFYGADQMISMESGGQVSQILEPMPKDMAAKSSFKMRTLRGSPTSTRARTLCLSSVNWINRPLKELGRGGSSAVLLT